MTDIKACAEAVDRHTKNGGVVGFQFSGGRDSVAALFLLRECWSKMRVYHLDSGDQFPEVARVVREVEKALSDHGVEIHRITGQVQSVVAIYGLPSDLVPVDNHSFVGLNVSGRDLAIQSRYECCARSIMFPMHSRMLADGVTLIVRGQRDEDYASPPFRSGDVSDGMEVLYPIEKWTGKQVLDYLDLHDLPRTDFYTSGMKQSPDCMHCTAWWDEGRMAYLKKRDPSAHARVAAQMIEIRAEVHRQLSFLDAELGV